ncbi:MAG: enoyl-CoA hydratase-related protein [Steroidobacteraceae bacterium]
MSDLQFEIRDGVARFTLNRPEARNAMPSAMYRDFARQLRRVEQDGSVRVILVTGAGKHFCAGGDVKEFASTVRLGDDERAAVMANMIDDANDYIQLLARMPQPVVVSARGMAVGGGLAIICAADLAIVSESCRMVVGQINIGGIPDACVSYNLVRLLGVRRAKQFCLLGDTIDAQAALDFGLVNWVVPDDELEARTEALVARLAKGPGLALGLTKAALNEAHTKTLAEHCAQEPLDVAACVRNDDFKRAVQAMVAKISG